MMYPTQTPSGTTATSVVSGGVPQAAQGVNPTVPPTTAGGVAQPMRSVMTSTPGTVLRTSITSSTPGGLLVPRPGVNLVPSSSSALSSANAAAGTTRSTTIAPSTIITTKAGTQQAIPAAQQQVVGMINPNANAATSGGRGPSGYSVVQQQPPQQHHMGQPASTIIMQSSGGQQPHPHAHPHPHQHPQHTHGHHQHVAHVAHTHVAPHPHAHPHSQHPHASHAHHQHPQSHHQMVNAAGAQQYPQQGVIPPQMRYPIYMKDPMDTTSSHDDLNSLLENLPQEMASEVLRATCNEIIDDLTMEIVFEMHKKLKLGQLCLSCNSIETVDRAGYDIFGQVVSRTPTAEAFECINCKRQVHPSRFAPHLEKCMGQGRNSSRLANKRLNAYTTTTEIAEPIKEESDDEYKDDPSFDLKVPDGKKKPPAPSQASASSTSGKGTKLNPAQLIKKPKGRPRKNAIDPDKSGKQMKLTAKSLRATVVKEQSKKKKSEKDSTKMETDSYGESSPQVSEIYVDILGDDGDGRDAFGNISTSWMSKSFDN